jgi:hypothetical protein
MRQFRERLRALTQWLPFAVLVFTCVVEFSPLGVLAALGFAIITWSILNRFGLASPVPASGGATLLSARVFDRRNSAPAGDTVLSSSELGMGGPEYSTQMLRDGALVWSISAGWCDVGEAGLRVGLVYDGYKTERLAVYDERRKRLLLLRERAARDAWNRLCADSRDAAQRRLDSMLADGAATQYHGFRGLWLPEGHPGLSEELGDWLYHTLPSGHSLSARLLLPHDLRLAVNPERLAGSFPYELLLDGVPTPRHARELDDVWESAGGRCLAVRGCRLNSAMLPDMGLWHVRHAGQWVSLMDAVRIPDERGVHVHYDTRLFSVSDDGELVFEAYASTYTPRGVERVLLAAAQVELVVEWSEPPLRLPVRDGRFTVRVPGRGVR